jgi:hypothetical protein
LTAKRRVKDLLAEAIIKKSTKIMIAKMMLGRSAIPVLMILAPVFQAFEKSTGMRPSRKSWSESRTVIKG